MTLKEFAGVFSRYFVIGFFAPAFFAVVLVSQVVDPQFFPVSYRDASAAAKLAILGGIALLAGLVLSGLHYHVTRLFEGYPLRRLEGRRFIGWPHNRLLDHWRAEFDRRTEALNGEPSPERTRAAQELSRSFPARRDSILPTRFGNAVRAFETHGRRRYGLEGISAWPRISMLLSEAEREQVTEAQTDVAFFLNLALASDHRRPLLRRRRLLGQLPSCNGGRDALGKPGASGIRLAPARVLRPTWLGAAKRSKP